MLSSLVLGEVGTGTKEMHVHLLYTATYVAFSHKSLCCKGA
jgi:hypothetical protein